MLVREMFINYFNLILCLGIFIVGYLVYKEKKDKLSFNIALAFGLFAASHFIALLGIRGGAVITLVVIRVIGYLVILIALSKIHSAKT